MTIGAIPIDLTPMQRINLQTLADFLLEKANTLRFDMEQFAIRNTVGEPIAIHIDTPCDLIEVDKHHPCGTVACALGHGPLAGIKPRKNELWYEYSQRVFGATITITNNQWPTYLFMWLFSGDWAFIDNRPRGAAKRILWALENGVPENFREQIEGIAPLCYQPA